MRRVGFFLMMGLPALALGFSTAGAGGKEDKKPKDVKAAKGPNLLLDLSAGLIDAAATQKVDRQEPFTDVIDEVPVSGWRRTLGSVHVQLLPDPCRGVVEMVFHGCTYSRDVGHRKLVLTYTNTFVPFEVRQRVLFNPGSLGSVRGPATARARIVLLGATSYQGDPDTTAAIFTRAGFPQQQADLEAIVSGRTARQTAERMEAELNPSLAEGSKAIGKALTFVKDIGVPLEDVQFSTTCDYLQLALRIAEPRRVGPGPAPALPANVDLAVRVHDALINDTARAVLGGHSMKLSEVVVAVEGLIGSFLRDARREKERGDALKGLEKLLESVTGEDPSLTLAKEDPVVVGFADEGLTVEIHIAETGLGGRTFAGLRIQATFRLESSAEVVFALRQGPIRFLPADDFKDGKKLDAVSAAFRLVLEAIAGEVLKNRLELGNLPMPEQVDRLAAPAPSHLSAGNGWLTLAWKMRRDAEGRPLAPAKK